MGVGYALTENADTPGGVTRAADLDSYLPPTALDMCPVRTVLLEEGAGVPPLLVHGIGEPATFYRSAGHHQRYVRGAGRTDRHPAENSGNGISAILDEKRGSYVSVKRAAPRNWSLYGTIPRQPVHCRRHGYHAGAEPGNDHEAVFIDISGAAALHRIVSEDGVLSVGAAATSPR